jgi:hypothetical protein
MCKNTVYDCFTQNIWIATSGHSSTARLKYVMAEIGTDGVLFSINYPYEPIEMVVAGGIMVRRPLRRQWEVLRRIVASAGTMRRNS